MRQRDYERERVVAPGIGCNPSICFGRSRLIDYRVTTEFMARRFLAGETIEGLSSDYDVPAELVQSAIRYELTLAKRRRPRDDAKTEALAAQWWKAKGNRVFKKKAKGKKK